MAILHLISIHIFLGLTTALELPESRADIVGQTGVAGRLKLKVESKILDEKVLTLFIASESCLT